MPRLSTTLMLALSMAAGCDDGGGAEARDGGGRGDMAVEADGGQAGDSGQAADLGPEPDTGPLVDLAEPATCTTGTRYTAGTSLFVERTEQMGLLALEVQGTGLTVGDIDGDGYADLFVRRGNSAPDVFEPGDLQQRNTWLLRNADGRGFEDVTVESGVLATRGGYPIDLGRPLHVVAFGDVDNDGDQDIYTGLDTRTTRVVDWGLGLDVLETSELLLNDGEGRFTLAPADTVLRSESEVEDPSGATFVDFDRDGWLDFWQGQGGYQSIRQDRLFRNVGEGVFADVTEASGLSTLPWTDANIEGVNAGRGQTMAWSSTACDLNNDGWPELLAASYGRAPNHLWQGNGSGFVNRSVESGYAFDADMSPDTNEMFRCWCQGAGAGSADCEGVGRARIGCDGARWNPASDTMPFRMGGNSGATLCADFTGDGNLDLYTTEIKHWWAGDGADGAELLVNTGEEQVRFERPGREATGLVQPHTGVSWDEGNITAGHLDFDNDGRLDIYVGGTDYPGTRGLLFHNRSTPGTPQFSLVPIEDAFEHTRSQSMAVSDFDRDGDLDLIVGHSRMRCGGADDCYPTSQIRYFENIYGQDGNWMQLDLEGAEGTNRGAVGARVTIEVDGRTLVQEVGGGYGHKGEQTDRVLHFGLGAGCVAEVQVRWPDASLTTERFTLGAGRRYHLRQGEAPRVR